jgi:hypothetical protein
VLELQDWMAVGEQAVQVFGLEPDGGQRHPRLHAPVELQELDLEIDGGSEIRVILFQPPQFRHFARVRAARRRRTFPHSADITTRATCYGATCEVRLVTCDVRLPCT